MPHILTIEIPDAVYQPLAQKASQNGESPEQLVVEWLKGVANEAQADPVEKWIGAIKSDMVGWADRHDELIGDRLAEEVRSGQTKEG